MTASGMVILSGHAGRRRPALQFLENTIPTRATPPGKPPIGCSRRRRSPPGDPGGLRRQAAPARRGPGRTRHSAATDGNHRPPGGIPPGHPTRMRGLSRKLRPPMNQARNDGAHDDGWYHDDHGLPPSLGVWPLGRTYVHSSDGALNTGPATNGPGGPSGASGPATNGHRGRPGASGPATNRRRRGGAPDPTPPQSGRPPLYQVGGRYRGDDWPTDPGFRRGDLGLDDFPADPAPDRGRPDPGYDPGRGAGPDLAYAQPCHDPRSGGTDPGYAQPR